MSSHSQRDPNILCSAVYKPACGVFNNTYKLYSNSCELRAHGALPIHMQNCDKASKSSKHHHRKHKTGTIHPSWDTNRDGVNDCELDGVCDHTDDYTKPRPADDFLTMMTFSELECRFPISHHSFFQNNRMGDSSSVHPYIYIYPTRNGKTTKILSGNEHEGIYTINDTKNIVRYIYSDPKGDEFRVITVTKRLDNNGERRATSLYGYTENSASAVGTCRHKGQWGNAIMSQPLKQDKERSLFNNGNPADFIISNTQRVLPAISACTSLTKKQNASFMDISLHNDGKTTLYLGDASGRYHTCTTAQIKDDTIIVDYKIHKERPNHLQIVLDVFLLPFDSQAEKYPLGRSEYYYQNYGLGECYYSEQAIRNQRGKVVAWLYANGC